MLMSAIRAGDKVCPLLIL